MIVRVRGQVSGGSVGSYLLVVRLDAPALLPVGALGAVAFPAGAYVYCGNALGPGGVRARARRHVNGTGALHWHIDYLLRRARVESVWARFEPRRLECKWAASLSAHRGFSCPAPGFGSSDCRCRAHLWHTRLSPARLASELSRLPAAPRPAWPRGILGDMLSGDAAGSKPASRALRRPVARGAAQRAAPSQGERQPPFPGDG